MPSVTEGWDCVETSYLCLNFSWIWGHRNDVNMGVGNLMLCEAPRDGAFDHVNCQHSEEFNYKQFSKMLNA